LARGCIMGYPERKRWIKEGLGATDFNKSSVV
jgi:hypothetical protein